MAATLMLALGVAAIFVGFVLALVSLITPASRSGVSRSLHLLESFSAAPTSARAEGGTGLEDRVLVPLRRGLARLGRRLTPSDQDDRSRAALDAAGNPSGATVAGIASVKAAGAVLGLLGGVLITLTAGLGAVSAVVVTVGLTLLGYYAIDLWLYQKVHDRKEKIQLALADSLDLLTISVEAGLGFDSALSHVARNTSGPLSEEFARVLQEMQIGMARKDALRAFGERSGLPELRSFSAAMVQADEAGIPVGQVLRVQAREMRVKRRQLAEEKAQKVPIKMLFPLMFLILPTLFLVVMGPAIISLLESFGGGL